MRRDPAGRDRDRRADGHFAGEKYGSSSQVRAHHLLNVCAQGFFDAFHKEETAAFFSSVYLPLPPPQFPYPRRGGTV